MVVGDVGEAVEILALVEEAVLDLPPALSGLVEGQRADPTPGNGANVHGFGHMAREYPL